MELKEFEEMLEAELKKNKIEISYYYANPKVMARTSRPPFEAFLPNGEVIHVNKIDAEKWKDIIEYGGFYNINNGYLCFNLDVIAKRDREYCLNNIRHELAHVLYYNRNHKLRTALFRSNPMLFISLMKRDEGHNKEWKSIFDQLTKGDV